MIKRGDLVSVLDSFGNRTGPYLYVDGPLIPFEHPGKYDYSTVGEKDRNLWHYAVMRGEKLVFVLSAWATLMRYEDAED